MGKKFLQNRVLDKSQKVHLSNNPYNQLSQEKDLFKIDFLQGAPGTNDLVEVKWNALQPEIDKNTPLVIEPR